MVMIPWSSPKTVSNLDFELRVLRLTFTALDPVRFPATAAANILRGAFGIILRKLVCRPECAGARDCEMRTECVYARMFEPVAAEGVGPSGLVEQPRPFVLRATHLDNQTIAPGQRFHFDMHLFDNRSTAHIHVVEAFNELSREGLGAGRGRAELVSSECESIKLDLSPLKDDFRRVHVRFVTPTELKTAGQLARVPEFPILFTRLRDRISTLRTLYGPGPLEIDFRSMGERAAIIQLTRSELQQVHGTRRSTRTAQTHSIGGFTGEAEYQGDLREFIPYLLAARWTGVGRHTVWGKGELSTSY